MINNMILYVIGIRGRFGARAVVYEKSAADAKATAATFFGVPAGKITVGHATMERRHIKAPEIVADGIVRYRSCPSCKSKRKSLTCPSCQRETRPSIVPKSSIERFEKMLGPKAKG